MSDADPALVGQGLLSDAWFDAALVLFDDPGFVDVALGVISGWRGRLREPTVELVE